MYGIRARTERLDAVAPSLRHLSVASLHEPPLGETIMYQRLRRRSILACSALFSGVDTLHILHARFGGFHE
jgi:hypothetical protein